MKRISALVGALCTLVACYAAPADGKRADLPDPVAPQGGYALSVGGRPVETLPFKHYHYASFDMEGAAQVTLACGFDVNSVDVSPHSRGIAATREGNTIRLTLDKPGYVMVRINDTQRFFLFAEKPCPTPANTVNVLAFGADHTGVKDASKIIAKAIKETAASGKTLLFPAGTYRCTQLTLPSKASIHMERGATLKADPSSADPYQGYDNVKTRRFIYIKDAQGVRITGRGAIDGSGAQMRAAFADQARMRLILAVNSSDLLIEGVMLQDPGSWNTQILKCTDVVIRNVKLMNDIDLSNTDGFDPDATQRMVIEDCFAYCSDDNVAIKTTDYSGYLADVDDITVRGCVFLTKKSSLKVGTESRGERMRNITFENNDVIESDRGMALYCSDGATFENIRYIDNRFERNHPDAKQCGIHFSVDRRNTNSRLGLMKGILIKDCTFEVAFPKKSEIKSADGGEGIEAVIENLTIADRKIASATEANMTVKNSTVTFK